MPSDISTNDSFNRPYPANGNRFAAKVITDSGYRRREAGDHPGRDHDHRCALTLAIAACDSRNACQQDVRRIG
jgi:hypothetical protein